MSEYYVISIQFIIISYLSAVNIKLMPVTCFIKKLLLIMFELEFQTILLIKSSYTDKIILFYKSCN